MTSVTFLTDRCLQVAGEGYSVTDMPPDTRSLGSSVKYHRPSSGSVHKLYR